MQNANLLLYVNLAGEVFYIIGHRMKSQKVKEDLQQRVYNDLAVAIAHPTVIQNLIKGALQTLELNLADVRILMDRIVHSSIMTVNTYSMEKLFELTLIATRYQYTVCQYPTDILLIALNHLDTIRKSINDPIGLQLTENLHKTLVDRMRNLDAIIMQDYRYAILSYLADVKLKMTNLIKLGLQKSSGEFVKHFPDKISRPELRKQGTIELESQPRQNSLGEDSESDSGSNSGEPNKHEDFEDDAADDDGEEDTYIPGTNLIDEYDDDYLMPDYGCHFENITIEIHRQETSKDIMIFEEEDEILEIEWTEDESELPEPDKPPVGSYIIRFYRSGRIESEVESVPMKYSYDLKGQRGTALGQSIYEIPGNSDDDSLNEDVSPVPCQKSEHPLMQPDDDTTHITPMEPTYDNADDVIDLKGVQGLDLCSILLGCKELSDDSYKSPSLKLHELCLEESSEDNAETAQDFKSMHPSTSTTTLSGINVVRFDARTDRSHSKAALAKISREFDIDDSSESNLERDDISSDLFFNLASADE